MERPKVRFLHVQPYKDGFILSDPYGISAEIFVPKDTLLLLSLMDGTRDLLDIKLDFLRATGILLKDEELQSLISFLRENRMLLSEEFYKALDEVKKSFISDGVRKPSHVGHCYPAEAKECELFLKGEGNHQKVDAVGVLVPHMDLRVAKNTYWQAYSRLKDDKEIVVILGVSHYHHEMPLSVFPFDFETPFGALRTDKSLVDRLQSLYDFDITHDMLSYRMEHSVEFQTLYAKLLYPQAKALAMIISYGDRDFLKEGAQKLLLALKGKEDKTLFISSVDMSHVGRKFGDPVSYDPSFRDKEYLSLMESMRGEDAFELLLSDNNSTRIDGQFTNLFFYYVLKELCVQRGKFLDYQIYHEEETDSKVSYASMLFS